MVQDAAVKKTLTGIFEHLNQGPADNQDMETIHKTNLAVMKNVMGFTTERKKSLLQGGGLGVFVTQGHVKPGTVVSMYPGTCIYIFVHLYIK